MEVLITGMHRSGTSAFARLLSAATGRRLLDDPEWAVSNPLLFTYSSDRADQLRRYAIVKCPRMAGVLSVVLDELTGSRAIWLLRDPRDILASIMEKVRRGRLTSMLSFPEIGIPAYGVSAYTDAYCKYISELRDDLRRFPSRILIVRYELFYRDRLKYIEVAAEWSNYQCDSAFAESIVDSQHGPKQHKFLSIEGPGRYTRDLSLTEQQVLEPATQAWQNLCKDLPVLSS